MRGLFVVLGLFAACGRTPPPAPSEATLAADTAFGTAHPAPLAGPPASPVVAFGPAVAGSDLTVTVSGAPPGARFGARAAAAEEPGRCPARVLGRCVAPSSPGVTVTGVVGPSGDGSLRLPIAPGTEGRLVYVQLVGRVPGGGVVRTRVQVRRVSCGDLVTGPGESCDDGGLLDGDGCDALCGCEADGDGDGVCDELDGCPTDPLSSDPWSCACEPLGPDRDFDGTPDCADACPDSPNLITVGPCGCGSPDRDVDGVYDCVDVCPDDPNVAYGDPGPCGCGVADLDLDGVCDPDDGCPDDSGKTDPGACGCGTSDEDRDQDLTPDCFDACPGDSIKVEPGVCGCALPDVDTDGDGSLDCEPPAP